MAWYNGTTSSSPELNPDGSPEDIVCVTPTGNITYQNAQCKTGYQGLLCTNCDNGWGNSRTFHCNECMNSVPTNTFLIFLGHLASFCYVAWLVRGSLASAAQVGLAEASHFEQFSDMMKVRLGCESHPSLLCLVLSCECLGLLEQHNNAAGARITSQSSVFTSINQVQLCLAQSSVQYMHLRHVTPY